MEIFKNLNISEKAWLEHPIYEKALDRFQVYQAKLMKETLMDDSEPAAAPVVAPATADNIVERIVATRESIKEALQNAPPKTESASVARLEDRVAAVEAENKSLKSKLEDMTSRFAALEARLGGSSGDAPVPVLPKAAGEPADNAAEEDDDIDLFGSDDEEEDAEAEKLKEERIAAYNAKKKAKEEIKGAIIAKSNIILDIKPWDDETDMAVLESEVRKIETDGLLWGAGKLVAVGYGIRKLQITCVVEDSKVGTDFLEEEITGLEDYVQSVDIAGFNKI